MAPVAPERVREVFGFWCSARGSESLGLFGTKSCGRKDCKGREFKGSCAKCRMIAVDEELAFINHIPGPFRKLRFLLTMRFLKKIGGIFHCMVAS